MRDGERTAAGDYQGEPEKDLSKVLVQRAINGIKRAARKEKGPDRTIERRTIEHRRVTYGTC